MKIRPATLEDWAALAELIGANNAEQHTEFGAPDFTRLHLDTAHIAITSGAGGVYLAFDGDLAVGFTVNLSFPSMPVGYVEGMGTYVLPEYRRTKVAHELGRACLDEHYRKGGRYTYGNVALENHPSISRCLKEGAEIVGLVLRYKIPAPEAA